MKKVTKLIYLSIFIILFYTTSIFCQAWFDSDWYYRKIVNIENTSQDNLINYQIKIVLNDSNFDFTKPSLGGADIRVTDNDGVSLLPFWLEIWNPPNAIIWAKVPMIAANSSMQIYIYYGNPNASSISDGESTFLFFDDFENFVAPIKMNAPNYLITPTYDGSGQAVHPDVLHIPGGWNGYEYWMAMTPFPFSDDDFENPSIIVSNDGLNWIEPSGISNPLVPKPPDPGYNNDPDILLVNDTLILYYNETGGDGNTYVKRMVSSDGITWTTPDTVLGMPNSFLSPAVIYENNIFYMWYVRNNGCNASSSNVYMRTSNDGINWSEENLINISNGNRVIWHIDIQKSGSKYVMVFCSYANTLGCLELGMTLFYAESFDKLNWTVTPEPLLRRAQSGWDFYQIYRASFTIQGSFIKIWYSANDANRWHIGYTDGDLTEFFGSQNTLFDELLGSVEQSSENPRTGNYSIKFQGGATSPQLFKDYVGRYSVNVWMYDDLYSLNGYLSVLRVWDLGNFTFPLHSIGLGIWTSSSSTDYSYHTEGFQYSNSSLNRTLGWHRLSINIKENTSSLLLDNNEIGNLDVLDESKITRFSFEGSDLGTIYFDDVYVRELSELEPTVIPEIGDQSLPVALVFFKANLLDNAIMLEWQTASEIDNIGFIIYRKNSKEELYYELSNYSYNSNLVGAGNSNENRDYNYIDNDVEEGNSYKYKLVNVDFSGKTHESDSVKIKYSVRIDRFEVYPPYPNPFNSEINFTVNIPYTIKSKIHIDLSIYSITGEKIKTLHQDTITAGFHNFKWNGKSDTGKDVASGIYFITLKSYNYKKSLKLVFTQ